MMPNLYDLDSSEGLREIVTALFLGYNYRLYTEGETRQQLIDAYRELNEFRRGLAGRTGDEAWTESLRSALDQRSDNLAWWILGLTNKTAQNLGVTRAARLDYFDEIVAHVERVIEASSDLSLDDVLVMLWAGAATLTIRGARKSSVGKRLERAFLKAALTIFGLEEGTHFWLGVQRDNEVGREVDAEVASRRGRIRIDMGLIERGNQEVIEDKINRVGPGGIVIFDRIGPRSNVWKSAADHRVHFIQIRNNRPLNELHEYLNGRMGTALVEPPSDAASIQKAVAELPNEVFADSDQTSLEISSADMVRDSRGYKRGPLQRHVVDTVLHPHRLAPWQQRFGPCDRRFPPEAARH